jgi:uncharacterized membrane protein HdeD (DUF308 family)
MIGIALIATGIAQALFAFKSKSFGVGAARFGFRVLAALAGLSLVARPRCRVSNDNLAVAYLVCYRWSLVSGFKWRPFEGWGWLVFWSEFGWFLRAGLWSQWD